MFQYRHIMHIGNWRLTVVWQTTVSWPFPWNALLWLLEQLFNLFNGQSCQFNAFSILADDHIIVFALSMYEVINNFCHIINGLGSCCYHADWSYNGGLLTRDFSP